MGACEVAAGKETDGLEPAGIGGVEYSHAVAEHVADIEKLTMICTLSGRPPISL